MQNSWINPINLSHDILCIWYAATFELGHIYHRHSQGSFHLRQLQISTSQRASEDTILNNFSADAAAFSILPGCWLRFIFGRVSSSVLLCLAPSILMDDAQTLVHRVRYNISFFTAGSTYAPASKRAGWLKYTLLQLMVFQTLGRS